MDPLTKLWECVDEVAGEVETLREAVEQKDMLIKELQALLEGNYDE